MNKLKLLHFLDETDHENMVELVDLEEGDGLQVEPEDEPVVAEEDEDWEVELVEIDEEEEAEFEEELARDV